MSKIGGSDRVREELTAALAEGRGVTAKVRWMTKADEEGRNKWIHCTPLLGINGQIGVWMVVIVNDERPHTRTMGGRQAPVVVERGRSASALKTHASNDSRSFTNGVKTTSDPEDDRLSQTGGSVTSLRI